MPESWNLRVLHLIFDLEDYNLFREWAIENRYADSAYTFRRLLEKAGLRPIEPPPVKAHPQGTSPKLGPGDAAYILMWCAWREAERLADCLGDFDEDDARQRFIGWWNDSGSHQFEQYGLRVLDTLGGTS